MKVIQILAGLIACLEVCGACPASGTDLIFPLDCSSGSRSDPTFYEQREHCAHLDAAGLTISPFRLQALGFDRYGLAAVIVGGDWYYVRRNGKTLKVFIFDNRPDGFSDGLTRSFRSGKVSYHDRQLREVIAPIYDWGDPFEKGRARVCNGCGRVYEKSGEHWGMAGGQWGAIDRTGRLIEAMQEEPANP